MSTIGYARVSTIEQNEAGQVAALRAGGADEIYVDHASGKDMDRPEWKACEARLHAGDVLIVTRIDRLGRSLIDLIETIEDLGRRGVEFRSLSEAIDTSQPGGQLLFSITGAFAQYERAMIRTRTREGLVAARARGTRLGRPPALTAEQQATIYQLAGEGTSIAALARMFNVSRTTIYRTLEHSPGISTR